MKVKDFLDIIECLAPSGLALDWDNSGLQVGDPTAKVNHLALALDPTVANIRQALSLDCQLLITHHPLIFKPVKRLSFTDPITGPACLALAGGLTIVSAHTNWDAVGVAQELAELLELTDCQPLVGHGRKFLKLVVFVPMSHLEKVRRAVFEAGAGVIGDYEDCSFQVEGQGGFKVPLEAKPYSGQPGSHHTTPEVRLEIILPSNLRDKADLAVRASHPYEEPAFEFYEITATGAGFGLVGRWNPARNGQETIAFLTKILGLNGLWAGPEVGTVAAVALMPGSGGDYLTAAKKAGADLLVTGDVNHHQALLAQEISLPVFSAGHFETERPSIPRLARELQKHMERLAEGVKLTILEENPPFRRM